MQQLIWREKQEFAWPGMTKPKKTKKCNQHRICQIAAAENLHEIHLKLQNP